MRTCTYPRAFSSSGGEHVLTRNENTNLKFSSSISRLFIFNSLAICLKIAEDEVEAFLTR